MEPIISPWVFYLIDLLDGLINLCQTAGILLALAGMFLYQGFEEKGKAGTMKKILAAGTILIVVSFLLPNSQTAYKMLAARYATPNNVQNLQNHTIDFAEKVAKAIENAKEKK